MRLSYILPALAAFLLAAGAAVLAATAAVSVIERSSKASIQSELTGEGLAWTGVSTDGLQVTLSGTAPDEATRFRAVSIAGQVVDPTRVIDMMQVRAGEIVGPPAFIVEILRNDGGISLIGLAPAAMDRDEVMDRVAGISAGAQVTDLLETAAYPAPAGWPDAVEFALDALGVLPRAKISVAADAVSITAIAESRDQRQSWEDSLRAAAPEAVTLTLDISAPRPVITPFTLRFLIDEAGPRFDACSAYSEEGRARILAAAEAAGLAGARCTLGLGTPSPRWAEAAAASIAALSQLGQGSVTFSDADITLVAAMGTPEPLFDRVVGELETALPDVFSLHAVLPEPEDPQEEAVAPEFVATLSPEGLLQLRGRITNDRLRTAVEGFARARFGGAEIYVAMRTDPDLPDGWAARVLASLQALSFLENGSATVTPEFVAIQGKTGLEDATAEISRLLSAQLGSAQDFGIDVTYEERLDPVADLPTPEECVAQINAILDARQITFAPGSADIDSSAQDTITKIAEAMRDCQDVPMEIGGHTDSQGRETMNQRLSQSRAESVLSALLARRVLTNNLTARGYGETQPIADNDTEEGREANRRIEFRLLQPEPEAGSEDAAAEADAEAGQTDESAPDATEGAAEATADDTTSGDTAPETAGDAPATEEGSADEQN
ncbi:MAG: OmpA family protein [Paracoccaceae bacterium]